MYNNSVQMYQAQYHHLVAAKLSSEQAEAIMHVIEERQVKALSELATKRDLEELRVASKRDLEELRVASKRDLTDLRTELKHDIAEVRAELKELRTELKHDLSLVEKNLNHRMTVGFIIMGILTIIGPQAPAILQAIKAMLP